MERTDTLQQTWTPRLQAAASVAYRRALRTHPGDTLNAEAEARDAVEEACFHSEEWAGIPAVEISDLAYEIVHQIVRGNR